MSINDPRKRYHGFIVPHPQDDLSRKSSSMESSPAAKVHTSDIDPTMLLSGNGFWNDVSPAQAHVSGSKSPLQSINIPFDFSIAPDDITMASVDGGDAGISASQPDDWTSFMRENIVTEAVGKATEVGAYTIGQEDGLDSIQSAACHIQFGSPHIGATSIASASPGTSGASSTVSSNNETAVTVQSHPTPPISNSVKPSSRSRSATTSNLDIGGSPKFVAGSNGAARHSRALSQSHRERPKALGRTLSTTTFEHSSTSPERSRMQANKSIPIGANGGGKAPRSRSRPSQRASIGPAAQANEIKTAAVGAGGGSLKIDTSTTHRNLSAAASGPHTVSGIPIPWSAGAWSPQSYPWPSPFAPSSVPSGSSSVAAAMSAPWSSPMQHWPAASFAPMWYGQHHPMMAVGSAPPPPPPPGYPFSSPHGAWTFQPALNAEVPTTSVSAGGISQGSLSTDWQNETVSDGTAGNAVAQEGTHADININGAFSLEDFLKEHNKSGSGSSTLFPPSGPDITREPAGVASDQQKAKRSKSPSEPKKSLHQRRTSRSSEKTSKGRILEDVPEAAALHSHSPVVVVGQVSKGAESPAAKVKKEGQAVSNTPDDTTATCLDIHESPLTMATDSHGTAGDGDDEMDGGSEKPSTATRQQAPSTKKTPTAATTATGRPVRPDSERRKRRRESHNLVERRRRDAINERIAELASLLPETMLLDAIAHSQGGGNNSKVVTVPMPIQQETTLDTLASAPADSETLAAAQARPNKGIILKKSVDYIRALQDFIEQQATHNRLLQEQLARTGSSPSGPSGSAAPAPAPAPASSWAIDHLTSTFDSSSFNQRQSSNDHTTGESPPQTLADWLAGKTTSSGEEDVASLWSDHDVVEEEEEEEEEGDDEEDEALDLAFQLSPN